MCERIWREDIITDYDDANQIIQVKQLFLLRKLNGKLLTHQISLKFCKDIVSQKLIHVFSEELKYSWFEIEIYPFIFLNVQNSLSLFFCSQMTQW